MMKRLWMPGVAMMSLLGVLVALAPAADPKDDAKAKKTSEAAEKIAMAYQLADIGRTAGSPEALIAAAKILSGIEEATVIKDAKPVEGKDSSKPPTPGDVIKGKEEAADFSGTVKELLDDAKKLAKDDKNLKALIESVKVPGGRGSIGGPKAVSSTIVVPGNHHTWTYDFYPNVPATVSVVSNSGRVLTLEVFNRQGQMRGSYTGRAGYVSWVPEPGHNPFTIRIRNDAPVANTYTLTTN